LAGLQQSFYKLVIQLMEFDKGCCFIVVVKYLVGVGINGLFVVVKRLIKVLFLKLLISFYFSVNQQRLPHPFFQVFSLPFWEEGAGQRTLPCLCYGLLSALATENFCFSNIFFILSISSLLVLVCKIFSIFCTLGSPMYLNACAGLLMIYCRMGKKLGSLSISFASGHSLVLCTPASCCSCCSFHFPSLPQRP
jgi:hypothetical protein